MLSEKIYDKIIMYTDKVGRLSRSVFIAAKPSPLFKTKREATVLFDPNTFTLTQFQPNTDKDLSQEKFTVITEQNLTEHTLLLVCVRKGYLLSNKSILPQNIIIDILLDTNQDLYYLIDGFSIHQNIELEITLVIDNEKIRSLSENDPAEKTIAPKILKIFKSPPSNYEIFYNGVTYEIKFGSAGFYAVNDQAGLRFIIGVIKAGTITSKELLRFGNKYFAKAVEDQINVIRRARRNKEELIEDLKTIEQNKNIPPEQALSKHLLESIKITEADYSISYIPVPKINWNITLPEDFFSY